MKLIFAASVLTFGRFLFADDGVFVSECGDEAGSERGLLDPATAGGAVPPGDGRAVAAARAVPAAPGGRAPAARSRPLPRAGPGPHHHAIPQAPRVTQ